MTLHKDIREFIELCLSRKVEFLLVGGYALAFHGAPRFTEDIDLMVLVSPENADKLFDVLTGISGVTWEEAWTSRTPVILDDIKLHAIGRSELIRNNQASGRPQDLADLARLRQADR